MWFAVDLYHEKSNFENFPLNMLLNGDGYDRFDDTNDNHVTVIRSHGA